VGNGKLLDDKVKKFLGMSLKNRRAISKYAELPVVQKTPVRSLATQCQKSDTILRVSENLAARA
jgi:hypothetical protein